MNLKYNILWVEDNQFWAKSIEKKLRKIVEPLGFEFVYTLIPEINDSSSINYRDYDLILMDFNLQNIKGDIIIEDIRNQKVLTDVVFYSANEIKDLQQKALEKGLEGVYYSSRDNASFIRKVELVIQSTIRKIQDLQNLRGLVMAEVSELDGLMEKIIAKYFLDINGNAIPEKETIFKELLADFEDDYKNALKKPTSKCPNCHLKIFNRSANIIIHDRLFESSKKARTLQRIIDNISFVGEHLKNKTFINAYNVEIIDVRNQLAHCESTMIEGKEALITKIKENGELRIEPCIFDDNRFKEIRQNILKYHNLFEKILIHLQH